MKILALSDQVVEHLYSPLVKERFGDVDLVVGCGDLPDYYLDYIVSMLNVPLTLVPGNHDLPTPSPDAEGEGEGGGTPRACGNIDGMVVEERGLLLAGLGGSIRYRPDGVHQYTQGGMARRILALAPRLWWNRLRYGRFLDILVTHAPPRGIHDAEDPAHVGFEAFNRFIARYRPRYLLHGHAHVYRHDAITITQVGPTTVINVYPYRVIDIEGRHAG
ncbi:MAG: metallophosphoesterase [candidate division NC10 bacterium]|nr:metallophosphoesterase [candidate division NC10 bacterium]MBI2116755.1 metallophosphoesterase [candidate division NC10 bacterium]MBI2455016.1 metallophosphoesterase [candidate division NC10 bacterium]MBI3121397.1 metallophosphoesterase [candidate division NC10 bacterium]